LGRSYRSLCLKGNYYGAFASLQILATELQSMRSPYWARMQGSWHGTGNLRLSWSTGVPFWTRRIQMVQNINFVPIFITRVWAQNVIEYAQSSDANAYARGNVWTYVKSLHSSNLHTSFSLDLFRLSVFHYSPSYPKIHLNIVLLTCMSCSLLSSGFPTKACMYVHIACYLPTSQYNTLRIFYYGYKLWSMLAIFINRRIKRRRQSCVFSRSRCGSRR